jgi:hypothetical protein
MRMRRINGRTNLEKKKDWGKKRMTIQRRMSRRT